jgi:signal transduction histidine kinase
MQSAEYAVPVDFSAPRRRIAQGIAHLFSLGIQYARLVDELERANRLKSDFVATISHELRTPLHAIIGYNDLVLDGDFGPLNEEQQDALMHVRRSSRHLRDVIDGILDLSRLERGQLPLQQEDLRLADFIARIDDDLRPTLDRPAVQFRWDVQPDLPVIRTDPGKLSVVLKNVIGNAFKFTPEGEVIVAVRADNGSVEFRVTDTGIGIAQETLPLIFEPFRQGERYLTRRYDGLGLGLYVVRRLVEVLGGTIKVDTEVGRGSSFSIAIPRHADTDPRVES